MPTLALSNSVAYTALDKAGLDTIKAFPPIRTCGTIGFICSIVAGRLVRISGKLYAILYLCGMGSDFGCLC